MTSPYAYHDLEVMSSNPSRVKLEVHSTAVLYRTKNDNNKMTTKNVNSMHSVWVLVHHDTIISCVY